MIKIFGKSKHVLFVQIFDKVFYFVLFLVLARLLSVNEFGNIVLIFSISNILLFVLQFGLPIIFQRQTAKENRINKSYLFSAVIYGFASYLLSMFLILLIVGALYGNNQYLLIVVIHSFVFSYYFISIFNSFLLGKGEQRIQSKTFFASRLISVTVILLLLYFLKEMIVFLGICLAGNVAIALVFYFYILNNFLEKDTKSDISYSVIKYLFLTSLPIGLAAMSNFLYDKIDVIIISKIIDVEQVAYYNVAYGFFKASHLLFSFVLVTGFSRVSLLSARRSAVKLFLKKYFVYILFISSSILLLTYLFSEGIISLVYGDKYMPSVFLLQTLSLSIIPLALNNLTGITINAMGMFKENLAIVLSALLINVVFNVILLSTIGVLGAVYSTLITEVYILVLDLLLLKKKLW